MNSELKNFMRDRQRPLTRLYKEEPKAALVVDHAHTTSDCTDPLHGELRLGPTGDPLRFSLHQAVGGESDLAVPGDILCAALASCFDSTLRVIANRMGITVTELSIGVRAHVDVRGTLCVSPDVSVGFSRMTASIRLRAVDAQPHLLKTLIKMTEHCCVVYQTLRHALPIALRLDLEDASTQEASHA